MFYPAGSGIGTQRCVNISIYDDDTFEGTHSFTVDLLDPGNPCCNVVFPSTIEIDILDNESQCVCVCVCVFVYMYVYYICSFCVYVCTMVVCTSIATYMIISILCIIIQITINNTVIIIVSLV